VDDEEMVRSVARATLERYGYTVLVAGNGKEALDIYRGLSHSISMVVLDMTMPKMGGEEALENLVTINPGVRVLLSSGFDEAETVRRFSGRCLAGFIQKPYSSGGLAAKVQEILDAAE
jgi:DNA-binding NtrC family response regulator